MQMKKILMVVYNYFPTDPRVRREAEALNDAGYSVDVICLRLPDEVKEETIYNVNVFRINMSRIRSTSKKKYVSLYSSFFIRSFFKLNKLFIKNKYDVIHIHNMPDFLVFVAIIPKLLGKKIILDLHDPSPEMLMTKFSDGEENSLTKLLKWQERISIKFAHTIITTNKSFSDKFIFRGSPPDKVNIVMNSPQESIFNKFVNKPKNKSDEKKFVLMYHGVIVERHGLDDLVRAVNILRNKISGLELIVFGLGEYVPVFLQTVEKLKLDDVIKYYESVPIDKIAEVIPECDIGIIPNKLGSFTNINFPTRIFEYLCMKKPVVVPRTQGIKDYFDEGSIFYFDSGNVENLAEVIFNIYSDPAKTLEVVIKGYEIYQKYRWENQSKVLIKIYEELLN